MESTPPSSQRPSGTVSKRTIILVVAFCVIAIVGTAFYSFYRFAEYGRMRREGIPVGSTLNSAYPDSTRSISALNLPADYRAVPDTARLVDQRGVQFRLGDLRGSVVVVDFFFSRCTGPCPTMNRGMAQLATQFAAEPKVKFLSVTVDPLYDTPARLASYAKLFEADTSRWIFANAGGPQATYDLAATGFAMSAGERQQPDTVATIFHDERYVIVDRHGRIRGYVHVNDPQWKQHTIERVQSLLREE